MKDILRLIVVLTSLCIVAAIALAKIYDLTKGPIAYQKRLEVLRAIKTVLPPYDNEPDRDMVKLPMRIGKRGGETQGMFYRGRKAGSLIGVAFKVTSPEGYGGDIEVMVGLLPNGIINGVEVLSGGQEGRRGYRRNYGGDDLFEGCNKGSQRRFGIL
jgi:electron transport complex protein RnfG